MAEIPVPAEGDSKQKTAAMMQQVARLFEAGIRAHPQDWHMLQRVFAANLDPARLAAAQSTAGTGRMTAGHEGQPCPPESWDAPPPLPEQSGWSPPGTRSS